MKQRTLSLFTKLFIVAMLMMLLPIFIFSVIFSSSLNQMSLSKAQENAEASLVEMDEKLDDIYTQSLRAAKSLSNNYILSRSFLDHSINPNTIYLMLYQASDSIDPSPVVNLYDATGMLVYTINAPTLGPQQMPLNWGILREVRETKNAVIRMNTSQESEYALMAANAINYRGIRVGYLTIGHPAENLQDVLQGLVKQDANFNVLGKQGRAIFTKDGLSPSEEEALRLQVIYPKQEDFAARMSEFGEDFFDHDKASSMKTLTHYNPERGYSLILSYPKPFSPEIDHLFGQLRLISLLVVFIFSIFVSLRISRSLSTPISTLNRSMNKVREGDLYVQIPNERDDELGELIDSFNEILAHLKLNVDEKIRQTYEINDAHILLLQTQLTPHFLYNTLDTIKWLAKMGENEKAVTVTEMLAQLLRRSVSNRRLVSLIEEVDTVEYYLKIQSVRFSGKFVHATFFSPGLEACLVPNMILQPIVENAIIHGLQDREEGYIHIQARQEGEKQLVITVSDNGCGIPPDQLAEIRKNLESPEMSGEHLGLRNTKGILKRIWGDEADLSIRSIENVGTEVTLTLPLLLRDPEEDERG